MVRRSDSFFARVVETVTADGEPALSSAPGGAAAGRLHVAGVPGRGIVGDRKEPFAARTMPVEAVAREGDEHLVALGNVELVADFVCRALPNGEQADDQAFVGEGVEVVELRPLGREFGIGMARVELVGADPRLQVARLRRSRIVQAAGDIFRKHFKRHMMAAGCDEKQTIGRNQFSRHARKFSVTARSRRNIFSVFGKSGRIGDDDIKSFARFAHSISLLKNFGIDPGAFVCNLADIRRLSCKRKRER